MTVCQQLVVIFLEMQKQKNCTLLKLASTTNILTVSLFFEQNIVTVSKFLVLCDQILRDNLKKTMWRTIKKEKEYKK